MRTPVALMILALMAPMALVGLAGCDAVNADRGESEWHPKGLNAANLAAMVDNPADLARGRSDPGPDRKLSAHAVTELWANPTPSLSAASAAAGVAGPSGGGGSGAGN